MKKLHDRDLGMGTGAGGQGARSMEYGSSPPSVVAV